MGLIDSIKSQMQSQSPIEFVRRIHQCCVSNESLTVCSGQFIYIRLKLYVNRHFFLFHFLKMWIFLFVPLPHSTQSIAVFLVYFPERCYTENICITQIKILEVKVNKVFICIWNNKLVLLWFLIHSWTGEWHLYLLWDCLPLFSSV